MRHDGARRPWCGVILALSVSCLFSQLSSLWLVTWFDAIEDTPVTSIVFVPGRTLLWSVVSARKPVNSVVAMWRVAAVGVGGGSY